LSRHGKLKTRSVPACAEFNQDERVLPEHKLEVKHIMARVKAIIDLTQTKMTDQRTNLSAEDPTLIDYEEMCVALVIQIGQAAEGKAEDNEVKAKKKAELAKLSCAHGYGDAGMFAPWSIGDAEHDPSQAAAAAAAGAPIGPAVIAAASAALPPPDSLVVAAGAAGKAAAKGKNKAFSQDGDDDGMAALLAQLDESAAKRARIEVAKERAAAEAAEVERLARRAAEAASRDTQVRSVALQETANANMAAMLAVLMSQNTNQNTGA
jgi:hypothetical protein